VSCCASLSKPRKLVSLGAGVSSFEGFIVALLKVVRPKPTIAAKRADTIRPF
jgi:hypothetical protein